MFNAFIFSEISSLEAAKTVKMAQKSRFGARRAPFSDFQAVLRGNFRVLRHSADFFPYFSSVSVAVAIPPSFFRYFPDVERQGSGDGPRAIRYTIVARDSDCIATSCGP